MTLDISIWEQTFQELIQKKKPRVRWTLKLDERIQPDNVAQGWRQYQQNAFGRFQCSSCQRRWASAKVQVLCHMYQEHWTSQGQVLMRLFAQRCKKCRGSRFEKPEFSSENTIRILSNLVHRILERFYGKGVRIVPEKPVIVEVPLEGSHDIANCEACVLGFCQKGFQTFTAKPPTVPLSGQNTGCSLTPVGDTLVQNQTRNKLAEARLVQKSGHNSIHMGLKSSHVTAGTQVTETRSWGALGINPQAPRGTGPYPIQGEWPLLTARTNPHDLGGSGPHAAQREESKVTCMSDPQTAGRTRPQATTRSGPQPPGGRGSQTPCRRDLPASQPSGSFNRIQATSSVTAESYHTRNCGNLTIESSGTALPFRSPGSSSPRRSTPNTTFQSLLLPPHDNTDQIQRSKWGWMFAAVTLIAFIVNKYL